MLCAGFLPIVKSYSQAVLPSSFFTYNKPEPLGQSFTGDDRMDSRLAEGFRKIPETRSSPSFCSATAGLLPGGQTHSALESC